MKDVSYLNPEHVGDVYTDRRAIFDVYCEGENSEKYGNNLVEIVRDWVTVAEDGYLTLRFRALLLSLLALEDLFFGQIDIGYTSLKFLNTSRITDILGSSPVSSQLQVPLFRF